MTSGSGNPAAHRCWVEVSLSQIETNYRAVKSTVGPGVEVMPVVKADAYRHGSVEVSRALEAAGARWLAVSSVEEGVTLREGGVTSRILVMADYIDAERAAYIEFNLTPAIHSLEDLSHCEELASRTGRPLDVHLKVDTGMGRLGSRADAARIADALTQTRHVRLEGLMTHFASSSDYANPQTAQQTERFWAMASQLAENGIRPRYTHLASTIPIAYGRKESWGNMVRPGHAIYGYVSPARGDAPAQILRVRPALSWKARIVTVKDLPEGSLVGYGGMHRTTRPTRVAVIGAGYADGFPHRLSNKGRVLAAGRAAPILGAVSMDVTTIDITQCPELKPGDAVTLLGSEGEHTLDAHQIARLAGTISYSVLCGISVRVKRVYV
jgi:alanine racemase